MYAGSSYKTTSVLVSMYRAFSRKFLPAFGLLLAGIFATSLAKGQCPSVQGTVVNTGNSLICSGQSSPLTINVTPASGGTFSGSFTNGRSFAGMVPVAGSISGSYVFVNNGSVNVTETFILASLTYTDTNNITCPANATSGSTSVTVQPAGYYYVNDSSRTGDMYTTAIGNDATGTGSKCAPFATLQYAIQAAPAGTTVYVDAGTYREDVVVNKTLTIRGTNYGVNPNGAGPFAAAAVLQPFTSNPATGGPMIYLESAASGSMIDGFTLDGDNTIIISGVIINGADINAREAIGAYAGLSNTTISNNIIKNLNYAGVDFDNFYNSSAVSTGNTITNNKFSNIIPAQYGAGIVISDNCYTNITNNRMDSVRLGIQTGKFSVADPANSHRITNNTITASRVGIWHDLTTNNASAFIISNNTISTYNGATNHNGLLISSLQATAGVAIDSNMVNGAFAGISLWNNTTTNAVTIGANTFTGCNYGVFANNYDGYGSDAQAASSYIINGANIQNAGVAGIYVKDNGISNHQAVTVQITGSTVINTTTTGLKIEGAAASAIFSSVTPAVFTGQTKYIDLASNGTTVPATSINATAVAFDGVTGGTATLAQNFIIEDKISHKIDSIALGFVLVKANNDFVTVNSHLSPGTAAKIQRGVAAADSGFTVNVAAGTFADNIIVNKEVMIAGAGQTNTIVQPAVSAPNTCNGLFLCAGASNIFLVRASNVTIQNLTADGDNPALTGMNVGGANVDARNGIITDHNYTPFTVFNKLNITNVTVKNVFLSGMCASIGGTFNFSNNTVTNVAGDSALSVAILNFGGSGSFTNNTIDSCADGIASKNSRGTRYSDNIISNSLQGIHTDNAGAGGGTADTLINNTVQNGPIGSRGIFTYLPSIAPVVQANTITNVETGLANFGQVSAVTPKFILNRVDAQHKANSIGIYQTTAHIAATSNVSGIYINNFIQNNSKAFEVSYGTGRINTITANENAVTGNTTGVALDSNGGTLVNSFTCNQWDTSSAAPVVATAVGAPVNYVPYLSSGTDAQPITAGFQPGVACTACTTLTAIISKTNITCNGGNSGTITAAASGGVEAYTYTINPIAGSQAVPGKFTGLPAGTYTITAFGANGCNTSFAPVTITQPTGTVPDVSVAVSNVSSNFFPSPMTEITIVYQLIENAGHPAPNAILRITKQDGYNFSFPNQSSVSINGTPVTIDNLRWTADNSNGVLYYISLNSGNQINCQSAVKLAVKITRSTPSKSNYTLTSQIYQVLSETNFSNNTSSYFFIGN